MSQGSSTVPPPPTGSPEMEGAGSGSAGDKIRGLISRLSGGGIGAIEETLQHHYAQRKTEADLARQQYEQVYREYAREQDPTKRTELARKYEVAKQQYDKIIRKSKDAKSIFQKSAGLLEHLIGHQPQGKPQGGQGGGQPKQAQQGSPTVPPPPKGESGAVEMAPTVPPPPASADAPWELEAGGAPEREAQYQEQHKIDLESKTKEAEGAAQITGMRDGLKAAGFTDDQIKEVIKSKVGGAGIRQHMHPVKVSKPDGTEVPALQNLLTGEVFGPDGQLIEDPKIIPVSLLPSTTTSTSAYNADTGVTSTSRTTQRGSPTNKKGGRATTVPPPPGSPEHGRVATMAESWADHGIEPPAKDKAAVEGYMATHDMAPGFKPTGASRSRADAARAVMPLVEIVKQKLADPEIRKQLGVLPGRVSEAEKRIGNLDPKIANLYGTLKSVYSLAGAMHGWRSIKVAEEFEKAYGGLHTNPDALLASMDAMIETAKAVEAAGYEQPSHSSKKGPSVGDVEDGYRFKGGNAGDKANWEKVK